MNFRKCLKISAGAFSDLRRLIRNHRYEWSDDSGLLVAGATFHNGLNVWAPDGLGWQWTQNLVPTEGKNHFLDVVLHGTAAIATWYVAPFSGNVSPGATWTAANFNSNATELSTGYSESTRVAYVEAAASAGITTNSASAATFTAASDAVTIWGAGLLSVSTKQSTSGVLLSASKYTAIRTLASTGDTLGIIWSVTLT